MFKYYVGVYFKKTEWMLNEPAATNCFDVINLIVLSNDICRFKGYVIFRK